MAPPATVRVGPHEYRVQMVPHGILGDAGRVGQCNPARLVISIDADQERSQIADTLLHELTHAILNAAGLDDDLEEKICLVLGPGLLALLRDNPDLVRWVRR